jgi:hypothetical protein
MNRKPRRRLIQTGLFGLCLSLFLVLVALPAAAQDGVTPMPINTASLPTINVNEIRPLSLTALETSARFTLNVPGPSSAIVQAMATTPGLAPTIRLTDPSGVLILNMENTPGLNIAQAPVNLPSAGTYVLEIRDRSNGTGDMVVAVQPGLPQVPPVGLLPGQSAEGTVGPVNPLQVYLFNAQPTQALLLNVNGTLPMPAPVVTVKNAITNETLALMSLQLSGVRYRIPLGAASYRVEVAYGGSINQEPYTICLETEDGSTPCAGLSPATLPTATPIAPVLPSPTAFVPPVSTTCTVQASGGGGVNVRTGPDVVFPIVGILSGATAAPVIGRSFDGAWWQINFGGSVAWVSAAFTVTSGSCGTVPVASAPPTPPPAATAAPTLVPPTGVPPTGVAPTNTPAPPTATNTPGGFDPPLVVTFFPLFPTATPTPGFVIPPLVVMTLNPGVLLTAMAPTATPTPGFVLPPFPITTLVFPGP